jgi:hypothetical protein
VNLLLVWPEVQASIDSQTLLKNFEKKQKKFQLKLADKKILTIWDSERRRKNELG